MKQSQSHRKVFSGSGLDNDVSGLASAQRLKQSPNRAHKSGQLETRSMNLVQGFLNCRPQTDGP